MDEEDRELEKILQRKMKELLRSTQRKTTSHPFSEGKVVKLTSENFDKVINNSDLPVLVDFWAEWCMPCHMMSPVVEALAKKYAGKAIVAKLNVDENPDIAQRYYIMGIPTFIIFKNGKPVEKIVGAVGRGPLEKALRKHLTA